MVRRAAHRRLAVALGCILQDKRVKKRKSKGVTHPSREMSLGVLGNPPFSDRLCVFFLFQLSAWRSPGPLLALQ